MAKTTGALIEETKRHLHGGQSQQLNKLNATAAIGATSLVLQFPLTGIEAGCRLAIGFEIVHVWDADPQSKTVIVERAQEGSTAAAHTAGSIVAVKPKFSDFAIFQALNDDIADLSSPSSGLFQVKTEDLTWQATLAGYNLVSDIIGDPLEVRYKTSSIDAYWPLLGPGDYEISRNLPTADFASGAAIFIFRGGQAGYPIRIRYKAPFGSLTTTLTEDVTTVTGLPGSALDIPPLGAAARLVMPREVKRNFTEAQGDSRRSDEVPPGAVANSGRTLLQLRTSRVMAEAARLQSQFPIEARNL